MALTPWVNLTAGQTDADSPVNETLTNGYRTRDETLYEWLGADYTPTLNHNHNGINSAPSAQALAILHPDKSHTGDTVFDDADTVPIYIPNGAQTIEFACRLRISLGTKTASARLKVGATTSTVLTTSSTSYVTKSGGVLDVSGVTPGWNDIIVQIKTNDAGETVGIRNVTGWME